MKAQPHPTSVPLAFEHVAPPVPASRRALFLHGMLGGGGNLRTLARRFVDARPGWDACLVDLRGHGASPKGSPDPSLFAAAADVAALCAGSPPVVALVGHSFGGKVALQVARHGFGPLVGRDHHVQTPLRHVVTLDTNPGVRPPPRTGDSAFAVIDMLTELPAAFPSRAAFVDAVIARGHSRTLAGWLALSTAPSPSGGVRFALDLAELRMLLLSYFAEDLWPFVQAPPDPVHIHQVIAGRSTSYSLDDRDRAAQIAAENPRVTVDTLPTDHWIHAEDPDGVLRILLARIPAAA